MVQLSYSWTMRALASFFIVTLTVLFTVTPRFGHTASSAGEVRIRSCSPTADNAVAIRAAMQKLPRGGSIILPAQDCPMRTTIALSASNIPYEFLGHAASEAGQAAQGTVLRWTGGAGVMFDIQTDARNAVFRDLQIDNTGSATHFLRANFVNYVTLENVMVRPTNGFSAWAIELCQTTRCEHVNLTNVMVRSGQVAGSGGGIWAARVHDFSALQISVIGNVGTSSLDPALRIGVPGSADVINFLCLQCSLGTGPNVNTVVIEQARMLKFVGGHFESDGTGAGIEIPAGANAEQVICDGCYFSSGWSGTLSSCAVRVNSSSANVAVYDSYMIQFDNPSYLVCNSSSRQIVAFNNHLAVSGGRLTDNYTAGNLLAAHNTLAGVVQPLLLPRFAFADLSADQPNGVVAFCSDCTATTPCLGGGDGAVAKRLNGMWDCD